MTANRKYANLGMAKSVLIPRAGNNPAGQDFAFSLNIERTFF